MRPLPHPVCTRAELLRDGLTERQIDYAVSTAGLRRLRRGVYCLESTWQAAGTNGRHRLAAIGLGLRLHPYGGVVSHASAAVLHGLPLPWAPTPVWGTVPPSLPTRYGPGTAVMSASLPFSHRRELARWSVTSVARTVADCLRHLGPVDGVAVADAALHRWPFLTRPVERVLEQCQTWPGYGTAARSWAMTDGRRESPAESWSYVAASRQGLPIPEPQVLVCDRHGRPVARVDAWWDGIAVVGEVDGLVKYQVRPDGDPRDVQRALVAEKKREDAVRALGIHVARWGVSDLRDEVQWAGWLREELTRGDRSRFTGVAVPTTRDTQPTYTNRPVECGLDEHTRGVVWAG